MISGEKMSKVIVAFYIFLLLQTSVHGQRFSLGGQSYPNHGLVLREDVGEGADNVNCISFSGCCDSGLRGEFYFPGSTLQVPIQVNVGSNGYYRNRATDRIFLNRQSSGTITGIFECRIRTEPSQTSYQLFYIGVYDADSGSPSIGGDIDYSSDDQILTCTSTGGPATTVVWRQNCVIIQESDSNYTQSQNVTNTQTASYGNTLRMVGDNATISDGVYTCSVSNSRGSSSSSVGIGIPVNVTITSSSKTAVAGEGFTLTCQATTTLMNPIYQWFDDSGTMVGSGSTLTLNSLMESSSGEYSCQVSAGSGADQRFGCGVTRMAVQAPTLTVTVNNATAAVAGRSHTLSCSVSGANFETATVMYTWRMNDAVIQEPSASNLYNIATDMNPIQVGNAGEVYNCEVTVTGASYWDVSGSFGGSGSATLSVTIPTPTIHFTLGSPYVGFNFTWRCEVEISERQLSGVSATVEWIGPNGAVITSDNRVTIGATLETSPGREFQKSLTFTPLSAGDSGNYSCSATVMPTTSNSLVTTTVGARSDFLSIEPGPAPPVCPPRWLLKSLYSLTVSWLPPKMESNRYISGYFLELVSYDNTTVLQSASVSNTLNYTFTGFSIAAGVPYHVRVYTEIVDGRTRGSYCTTTDFGDQLAPPNNILNSLISSYETSGTSTALLTWTVLSIDQTKGFVTLSITFDSQVNTTIKKRQTSDESAECSQSPCQVFYHQGRVKILGLNSQQDQFIVVVPVNEEGETGTVAAYRIAALIQSPTTSVAVTGPSTCTAGTNINSAAVTVVAVLVLLLLLSVAVITVLLIQLSKYKQSKFPAKTIGSENVDIMTTQCKAYEVMKMKDQPRGVRQTTSAPAATGPEHAYEEIGEGFTHRIGHGHEARTTPQQEQNQRSAH